MSLWIYQEVVPPLSAAALGSSSSHSEDQEPIITNTERVEKSTTSAKTKLRSRNRSITQRVSASATNTYQAKTCGKQCPSTRSRKVWLETDKGSDEALLLRGLSDSEFEFLADGLQAGPTEGRGMPALNAFKEFNFQVSDDMSSKIRAITHFPVSGPSRGRCNREGKGLLRLSSPSQ